MKWLIYGANGYSGELIARAAKKQGLQPILAGRTAEAVTRLGAELQLEARSFGLTDVAAAAAALADVDLVMHCAGPFSATGLPMLEACRVAGSHYVDITGEVAFMEQVLGMDYAARQAGIVICPAIGFDVVPTDCIAATLKRELPDATHLRLGFVVTTIPSAGTVKTIIEGAGRLGCIRRDHVVTEVPQAWRTRRIDFGDGKRMAMTVPLGDVVTAYVTTAIPNIEVYAAVPQAMILAIRCGAPVLRPLLGASSMQRGLKALAELVFTGPTEQVRTSRGRAYIWGEAENANGEKRVARFSGPNPYQIMIHAALGVVDFFTHNTPQPGSYSPAKLLGADFATRLPNTSPMVLSLE